VEIIGTNYGVQLEDICGIRVRAIRGKINENARDNTRIQKRLIVAQMNTTWVSRLEVNW
jgi:hypothetical protein